jgi:hypothetical protein
MQIVEFLDYPDALALASTCHEYRVLLYSQLVIDKYRQRMTEIHQSWHGYRRAKTYIYCQTFDKSYVYCNRCSSKLYRYNMCNHVFLCRSNKKLRVCKYKKPHVGACDCPYSKYGCYICGNHVYSHQYIDHIAKHIYDELTCPLCESKLHEIQFERDGIINVKCPKYHTIPSSRYQGRRFIMKWLSKKYLQKMQVTARLNPYIRYVYYTTDTL